VKNYHIITKKPSPQGARLIITTCRICHNAPSRLVYSVDDDDIGDTSDDTIVIITVSYDTGLES
jgi:hypothetical protein